eukprot:SAG22_NODE_6238_length_882_cov_0.878672_1_plen_57_part_10
MYSGKLGWYLCVVNTQYHMHRTVVVPGPSVLSRARARARSLSLTLCLSLSVSVCLSL